MNESSTPNRSRNPLIIGLSLAPALILLVVAVKLWSNHTETKEQLGQLSVQNRQLQQALAAAQAEISNLNSGDSSPAASERLTKARQERTTAPVVAEVETLFLQTPTVEQTSKGLDVLLEFVPGENISLPDNLTLVARVPASPTARILAVKPLSKDGDVSGIVNPAGTLGLIECSPSALNTLSFRLTVSEPVTATVRGSEGIIDFEIDITPEGCTVRKL